MAKKRHSKGTAGGKGGQFTAKTQPDDLSPNEPIGLAAIRKAEEGLDGHYVEQAESQWAFLLSGSEATKAATLNYLEAMSEARDIDSKQTDPPPQGQMLSLLHARVYRAFFGMGTIAYDTVMLDNRMSRDALYHLRSMIPWADVPSPEEALNASEKEWSGIRERFAALEDKWSVQAG